MPAYLFGPFHLLIHSSSSMTTLSLLLNFTFSFIYFFFFLPKLLPFEPKFEKVEIQLGYRGEKEGVSLIYRKLQKNNRINRQNFHKSEYICILLQCVLNEHQQVILQICFKPWWFTLVIISKNDKKRYKYILHYLNNYLVIM